MEKFNIDDEFLKYMTAFGYDIDNMPLDEMVEHKRTFITGASKVFLFITVESTKLDRIDALIAIREIREQLDVYWKSEQNITH